QLRLTLDIARLRTRRDQQNFAQRSAVGEALDGLLPTGNRRNLIDEEPANRCRGGEKAHQRFNLALELVRAGNVIAVEEQRGARAELPQGFPQLELEPGALAIL